MKYECEMIEDLLPLYKDNACSPSSKKAVEEHLSECEKCKGIFDSLNDNTIDEMIVKERDEVIQSQSKFFKRKSALAGSIIGAIFAIPIFVCLIVNLAVGHGLTWFFIVLAGMLVAASLIVVPLVVPKNRMFMTMVTFAASLILLLGIINIYTHGNWFFLVASAVIFGLTVLFSPFIACRRPVNEYLGENKGLAVMSADMVTFFIMIVCIGLYEREPGFFSEAFSISVPIIALAWTLFFVIRYIKVNGLLKAGICIAIVSLFGYFGTLFILFLTIMTSRTQDVVVYSAPSIATMVAGLVIAAVFAGFGVLSYKNKKKEC